VRFRLLRWLFAGAGIIFLAGLAVFFLVRGGDRAPARISIAAGGADGAYQRLVDRYNAHLKSFGVELVPHPESNGGFSNVGLLAGKKVQASFVSGGIAGALRDRDFLTDERIKRHGAEWNQAWPEKFANFLSLGRLLYEPLWVFYLGAPDSNRLSSLEGQPINIGAADSGTRILASLLLDQNSVHFRPSLWRDETLPELRGGDKKPLGDSRAAFLQLPANSPRVQGLLNNLAAHSQFDKSRAIKSAAFSPDSKKLVVVLADKTARIWDAKSGKQSIVLSGHTDEINDAKFSPDGNLVVTASDDDTAQLWDAASGKHIRTFLGSGDDVNSAAFSPDGTRVVGASDDDMVRVWDVTTGQQLIVLKGHDDDVCAAAFSPDGTRIVTGSKDATARIWDAASGRELAVLKGHEKDVLSAAFSPDGMRVVTASWDGTARVWDTTTGRLTTVLKGHEGAVRSASFSPDGKQIVTASWDNTARIWDATSGNEIAILKGHEDDVNGAAYSPDGTRIVTTSKDTTIRFWDTKSWDQVAKFKVDDEAGKQDAQSQPRRLNLMNFRDEADAYAIRFPFLSKLELPRGAISFEPDIPPEPVTLLATTTALVVDKEWAENNPSMVRVLTDAVIHNPPPAFDEKTHKPILFHGRGQFPSLDDREFAVSSLAVPIYKSGELPFLLGHTARMSKYVPFEVAAFLDEHAGTLLLSLIPILTILVPLIRTVPGIYNWVARRQILYWYRRLQAIERRLDIEAKGAHLHVATPEIDRIDAAVSKIRVPLNFSDQYYDLLSHIDLVRQRLVARSAPARVSLASLN
jgi:WD40 repeat protein